MILHDMIFTADYSFNDKEEIPINFAKWNKIFPFLGNKVTIPHAQSVLFNKL